ncbi:hypothetical protein SCP_0304900 [Sparassis crispa]|uniref:Uncharacterized protein n=1 Tax=Sparassis crispa TaxID=139825 RepID=A0A401GF64_9APHY|nr:hypothetical protein SCP_0304900 [Sparassis crispa]GBE80771.1 hypothetical protein SCP_0304900 [Sparassis crispa]
MTHARSSDSAQKFSALLQYLGGPNCSPEEVTWATDLPAGSAFLGWLADQLPEQLSASGLEIQVRSALEPIALSHEEATDARASMKLGIDNTEDTTDISRKLANYDVPSALHSQARFMEEEAKILKEETKMLKHRMLRASVKSADADIQQRQEQLGEISLEIDVSIEKSTKLANQLLDGFHPTPPKSKDVKDSISEHRTKLASLSNLRSEIVDSAERQLLIIEDASRTLPNPSEVECEAARLCDAFARLSQQTNETRKQSVNALQAASYCTELGMMCEELEAPNGDSPARTLENIVGQAELPNAEDLQDRLDPFDVNIAGEISRAWKLDQAALLASREGVLDYVHDSFVDHLLPPLHNLHDELTASSTFASSADAFINAFIEELEDCADDVAAARASSSTALDKIADEDARNLLEGELVDLLKQTQKTRAPDNGLLVLLDRADLAKELHAVSERLQGADLAEDQWIVRLPGKLSELRTGPASRLSSHIYANSPVNTSPPFSAARGQRILDADTKKKVDQLSQAVIRLQKESELNSQDERKMDTFIERWSRA